MHPVAGSSLDGYELIRKIGAGGFGEVWLARSEATGAWKALKWISADSTRHFEQEVSSLRTFLQAISSIRSPHLVPIDHVRISEQGLAYVMPLADGADNISPEDPAWEPQTVALYLSRHREAGTWFSSSEIRQIIGGVLTGASAVADAGLVHRDIKPENVLIIDGQPCLADFGLSTNEGSIVSLRGTPQHTAPSWYVENGGNADQWGVAALLYVLLTGNSPDKIGRARFLWPPAGRESLTKEEQEEWSRLHQIVLRATSEAPTQRFLGLDAFHAAVTGLPPLQRNPFGKYAVVLLPVFIAVALVLPFLWRNLNPSPGHSSPAADSENVLGASRRPGDVPVASNEVVSDSSAMTQSGSVTNENAGDTPIWKIDQEAALAAIKTLDDPNEDPSKHRPDLSKMTRKELRYEIAYWVEYARRHPDNPDPWWRRPVDPKDSTDVLPPNMSRRSYPWPDPALVVRRETPQSSPKTERKPLADRILTPAMSISEQNKRMEENRRAQETQ